MKLVDYRCPSCGAVREWFDDEQYVWCTSDECDSDDVAMVPIFSPKKNVQRWRHRDE
jgi:hypothetical protein